jgi:hypothetical protein
MELNALFWSLMAFGGSPPETVAAPECRVADPDIQARLEQNATDDQREREQRQYDGLAERDAVRLAFANKQVQAGRICTANDARNAAVVFQHSLETADHKQAWRLSRWACESGHAEACDWVAIAWDRALVSAGKAQWYGSQWVAKPGSKGVMCLVAVDPKATDADRTAAGWRPLSETLLRTWVINKLEPPARPCLKNLQKAGLVCAPAKWED